MATNSNKNKSTAKTQKKVQTKKPQNTGKRGNSPEKAPEQLVIPSTRIIHQIMPAILILAAVYVSICFLLSGSTGIFGAWLKNLLYGLFHISALITRITGTSHAAYEKSP